MTQPIIHNFHRTQENKYPEHNRNMTQQNINTNWTAYNKLVSEQKGGYNALPNPQLTGWNMQMRQPGYN